MKNLFKIIIALAVVLACSLSIFADEVSSDGGTADTDLTYTINSTYTVIIPETISVGTSDSLITQIQASYNLPEGDTLNVNITDGIDANGDITLNNTSGGTDTLTTSLYYGVAPGTTITSAATLAASFSSGLESSYVSDTTKVISVKGVTITGKQAGIYSGTITFTVSID